MGARETFTILFVEDDGPLRRAIKRLLTAEGFAVVAVGCGTDAFEADFDADGPFDAGVFDIDLPDINGVHVARRLLLLGHVGRAIFFTATTDESERARAHAHGHVVRKSDGAQALLATLRAALP